MKKKIVMVMMAAMLASLVACGQPGEQGSTAPESSVSQESTQESVETGTQESEQEPSQSQESDQNAGSQDSSNQGVAEGTMGQQLLTDFMNRVENGEAEDLQKLAESLLENPVIDFMPVSMPMEAGYFAGFSKEIDGFEECVTFSPMIGSIPFVGYVFNLEDGADVDAFVQKLKDNADPRWNICTEASETVVYGSGNTVFFVMCP